MTGHRLLCVVTFALAVAWVPVTASAQAVIGEAIEDTSKRKPRPAKEPEPVEEPIATSRAITKAEVLASVSFPGEAEAAVRHRWGRRQLAISSGDSQRIREEERELERLRAALAVENLFTAAAALVRESATVREEGQRARAREICELAARLAPDLAAAHRCVAWSVLTSEPWAIDRIAAASWGAVVAAVRSPFLRGGVLANELMLLLAGLALSATVLVALLVLRDGRLVLHDFHHAFPSGVGRWQSWAVALVLLAFPLLGGFGFVASLAIAGAAVALVTSRSESVILALALALLAGAPHLAGEALRRGTHGPVSHDTWLLEQGDAAQSVAHRLAARVADGHEDPAVLFALGRYHKRVGKLDEAAAWYRKAIDRGVGGEALNNLGNVRFLQGDLPEAQRLYRQANQQAPALVEPLFNLAKAYFRDGRLNEGQEAQRQSLLLDGDRVRAFGFQDDPRANLLLMDIALSPARLAALAKTERDRLPSGALGGALLMGDRSPLVTSGLIAICALLALVAPLAAKRLRPSNRCARCGRVACGRCDPELGYSVGMCGQCVSVFVRRTGVDPPDRLRKELAVKAYRQRLRWMIGAVAAVVAGAGHVLRGRPWGGLLFLLPAGWLAARLISGGGPILPPVASVAAAGWWGFGVGLALLAGVYLLAWRHLWRYDEPE